MHDHGITHLCFYLCFLFRMLRTYIMAATMALMWGMSHPCSRFEFRCKNDKCISIERLCNGIADCPDESDEPPECTRKEVFWFVLNFLW